LRNLHNKKPLKTVTEQKAAKNRKPKNKIVEEHDL
jgi:hypothetical protein